MTTDNRAEPLTEWPPKPKPLTDEEEAGWREALRDAPTLADLPPEATSLLNVTIAEWSDRMKRVFATLDAARQRDTELSSREALYFIFDGPPGPVAGRFVEVETADGASVNAGGSWHEYPGVPGLWRYGPVAALANSNPEAPQD